MPYKRITSTFIFVVFLIIFVKLEIEVNNITINEDNDKYQYKENKYLKVTSKNISDNIEYMKIQIEAVNSELEYVLSYYQEDSKFIDRKQLSQSISGKSFIFLERTQFNKDFYISIIFEDTPCEYNLRFILLENLELNLGEQYSYYVTEETRIMNFTILGFPKIKYKVKKHKEIYNHTYKISIWAKGSRHINTNLDELYTNLDKNIHKALGDTFNAYIVEKDNLNEFSFLLHVKGNLGDLIKIGAYLFNKNNLCQTPITDYKMEIFGLLKDNVMEDIYFLIDKRKNIILRLDTIIGFNNSLSPKRDLSPENFNNNFKIYSYEINHYKSEEFYFFSFKSNKPNKMNIFQIIMGANYIISLNKGETIGLIPIKTEINKNLNYQIKQKVGKYKASILNCDTYPFCKKTEKTKVKSILQYNTESFISYNEKEYENISPMTHNQKMLLLSCEDNEECEIYTNMYSQKEKILLLPRTSFYKYITAKNEDNYEIDLSENKSNENINFIINIEIISGDLKPKVKINGAFQQNNNPYEFRTNKNFDINISVTKNTVYSIIILEEKDNLIPQLNYKIAIKNNEKKIKMFKNSNDNSQYIIGFFSLGGDIEVGNISTSNIPFIQNSSKSKIDFYIPDQSKEQYNILLKNNEQKDWSYLYLSFFKYSKENNTYDSIFLVKNIEYSFLFTEDINLVKYMYIHSEKDQRILINLELLDNLDYSLDIFINDLLYQNKIITNNNKTIDIPSNVFKNYEENQPIKINFIIFPKNLDKEHIIKFKIVDENTNKDKDYTMYYIIIGTSILGVLLLALIIFILCLCKNKNSLDNLKEQINTISFKSDLETQRDSDIFE